MIETAARVAVHRPLSPEDQARADFYALLASLLHGAPDARLLGTLAIAGEIPGEGDPALGKAWADLVAASAAVDPEAVVEEHQGLFIGVGKAQVSVYAAFYNGATAVDHPRIRLRADLADLHLAKRDRVAEPDDHFAVLFEVMRVLVAGGAGRAGATVAEQKRFFQEHLEPGAPKFFRAVEAAPAANYYRKVAALGLAFLAIESESFQLG